MHDDRLTDELARRVMGWRTTSSRFLKPDRAWIPRWRFRPLVELSDAFQLLEQIAHSDIMRIMEQELGLPRRWIIPVPVLSPRLSSYWIHLVTPLSSKIARPLAEGLKNEVVCREDRITRLVPQKLLNVREAIQAALSQVEAHLVETNWSMAGPMPGDPDWSGGTVFRDAREVAIAAPAWAVFRSVCRVGGGRGWYANRLWRIRGWLDRLAGGPGRPAGAGRQTSAARRLYLRDLFAAPTRTASR